MNDKQTDTIAHASLPCLAWVVMAVSISGTLSFFRRMDSLRITSTLAVVIIVLISIMVILFYFAPSDMFSVCGKVGDHTCVGDLVFVGQCLPMLSSFVVFTNAFTCQQSLLPILVEMHNPTKRRLILLILVSAQNGFQLSPGCQECFNATCLRCCMYVDSALLPIALRQVSFILVLPIYLLIAVFSHLEYGDAVASDLLVSYPINAATTTARIGIGLVVITAYPIQAFVTRKSLKSIFGKVTSRCPCRSYGRAENMCKVHPSCRCMMLPVTDEKRADAAPATSVVNLGHQSGDCLQRLRGLFIDDLAEALAVICIVAFTMAVALVVDDLGIIVSIKGMTGATASTLVSGANDRPLLDTVIPALDTVIPALDTTIPHTPPNLLTQPLFTPIRSYVHLSWALLCMLEP